MVLVCLSVSLYRNISLTIKVLASSISILKFNPRRNSPPTKKIFLFFSLKFKVFFCLKLKISITTEPIWFSILKNMMVVGCSY